MLDLPVFVCICGVYMSGLTDEYLCGHLDIVRSRIRAYCACELAESDQLVKQVISREGKLIRPSLVLLGGLGFSGLTDDHYILASVVEMLHIASLLHDDVLDQAQIRRHEPTVNYLYGNKASVLLGDLLVACAVRAGAKITNVGNADYVMDMVIRTCEGELTQQRNSGNYYLSQEQYISIISGKTAALFAGCLSQGVRLAGADSELCQQAREAGMAFGLAFQIMDDVRDITSLADRAGKTTGTDFLQNKLTLPIIDHIACDGESAIEFLKANSDMTYTEQLQEELTKRLNSTGSLDFARNMATSYMETVRLFINKHFEKTAGIVFESIIDRVLSE